MAPHGARGGRRPMARALQAIRYVLVGAAAAVFGAALGWRFHPAQPPQPVASAAPAMLQAAADPQPAVASVPRQVGGHCAFDPLLPAGSASDGRFDPGAAARLDASRSPLP